MNLLVHEKKLLKNTKKYWISNGISNLFKKGVDSEPVYNDKYIETKKNYNDEVYTNFQYNEIPKHGYCTCLSVMLLDFIFVN